MASGPALAASYPSYAGNIRTCLFVFFFSLSHTSEKKIEETEEGESSSLHLHFCSLVRNVVSGFGYRVPHFHLADVEYQNDTRAADQHFANPLWAEIS